jgi:hypothetical protein
MLKNKAREAIDKVDSIFHDSGEISKVFASAENIKLDTAVLDGILK